MYPALLKAHLNSLVVALYITIELMIILTMKVTLNTLDPNDADFQIGEANTKNYIIIDKQFRVGSSAQFHPISCKDHKETLCMMCNTYRLQGNPMIIIGFPCNL